MVSTGIIIQARTDSKRFPNKVIHTILDKSIIAHVIERCKLIKNCDKVVLATTMREIDNELVSISKDSGIELYRGETNDVLNRYLRCAKHFGFTNIVRITGDCPLIDIALSTKVVKKFHDSEYDYVRTGQSYPDGLNTEVFSFETMEVISANAKLPSEKEHVTPYLWKNPDKFKIFSMEAKEDLSNYRFTVDYLDDLKFIRKIYENLYRHDPYFGLEKIIDMLKINKELLNMMPSPKRLEGYNKSLLNDIGP